MNNKIALGRWQKALIIGLVLFLVAFPKGGFKLGDIPVTWGYVMLGITLGVAFFSFRLHEMYIQQINLLCLALCAPFQIYALFVLFMGHIEGFGFFIALLVSFYFLPFLFLLVFSGYLRRFSIFELTARAIMWALRFVAVYGIVLFFYKIITGNPLFEIPFLTVNVDDAGKLETEKFIDRGGGVFKLISTYNNGNVYGVSLLLLMPFYFKIEKKRVFQILFLASLALTLSRTVWIGMVLYFVLYFIRYANKLKTWLYAIAAFIILGISVVTLLNLMGVDKDFLFDKDLGGRISQLDVLQQATLLGDMVFVDIFEIVYLSILKTFGWIGLVLFILYLFSPIISLLLFNKKILNNYPLWGILIYVVIAASDGAILYIPVMTFFWFSTLLALNFQEYETFLTQL